MQAIKRFELPPAAIAAHLSAVARLSAARPGADAKPADAKKPVWIADVLAGAEAVLSRYVESGGDGRPAGDSGMLAADWKAAAAVFTIGEVSGVLERPFCSSFCCMRAFRTSTPGLRSASSQLTRVELMNTYCAGTEFDSRQYAMQAI